MGEGEGDWEDCWGKRGLLDAAGLEGEGGMVNIFGCGNAG